MIAGRVVGVVVLSAVAFLVLMLVDPKNGDHNATAERVTASKEILDVVDKEDLDLRLQEKEYQLEEKEHQLEQLKKEKNQLLKMLQNQNNGADKDDFSRQEGDVTENHHHDGQKLLPSGRFGKRRTSYGEEVFWFEVQDNKGTMKNQSIPHDMYFLGSHREILYCPAAKCGTTEISNILQTSRCVHGKCAEAATALFSKSATERKRIMNSKPVSFTHVRNPWDRIWSTYKGKIVSCKIPINPPCDDHVPSFNEFLDYIISNPGANDVHWEPFVRRCLPVPDGKGNVFRYDHILRLEDNLDVGVSQVAFEAGLLAEKPNNGKFYNTEHSVEARHAFYQEQADTANLTLQELVNKVYELYKEDIDGLGYSFDRYG